MKRIFSKVETMKIYNTKATLVLIVFNFVYFLKMLYGDSNLLSSITSGILVLIGFSSAIYILIMKKWYYKTKVVIPFFIIYLFGIISSIFTHNYRIQDYILPIQYFGMSLILIIYILDYRIIRLSFLFYSFFFIYNMLVGNNPGEIFFGFSRNAISAQMIIHSILLYITMYKNNMKITFYPSIITLSLSFWAVGRSGIIASLILLLSVIIHIQFSTKRSFKIISTIVILGISYIVLTSYFYELILNNMFNRLLIIGLSDPHRTLINSEYILNMLSSVSSFLFGVSIKNNYIFSIYGFNLHSAYLGLHAYYGIIGILIIAYLFIRALIKYSKMNNILFFSFLLIILIRVSTDSLAFNGSFDPLFYFFIFNNSIFQKKFQF